MSNIRDILVIITTIITILGVFIKALNNLFLDCIKNKYMNVPAKQSIFDTVFKSISYIALVIDIIYMFFMLAVVIKSDSAELIDNTIIPKNTIQSIALVIVLLFMYIILSTGQIFISTVEALRKTIKTKDKSLKSERKYRLKAFFYKYIIGINLINKIISISFAGLSTITIIYISMSGTIQQNTGTAITIILIGIVGLSMFIISNSITPALKMLKKQDLYYLITKSDTIICRFFLEYLNFYLIVEKDCERYISRGEIIEIRKIY
ncbi:hypothetical protein [Clostridium sp.]|uniref:hypothetical protein n=1 Tax=Clostridium sp. TaxID=1506 RepID=UPI002849E1B4|nr:hypothetical protein [Clostridium sp.]MDR3597723.1 hypothetical protein [Clostridium sp.]